MARELTKEQEDLTRLLRPQRNDHPVTEREFEDEIYAEMHAIRLLPEIGILHYKRVGDLLAAAKKKWGSHGHWLEWLDKHTQLHPSTAEGYMRLAERWDWVLAKTDRDPNFPLRRALLLLRDPTRRRTADEENPVTLDENARGLATGLRSDYRFQHGIAHVRVKFDGTWNHRQAERFARGLYRLLKQLAKPTRRNT